MSALVPEADALRALAFFSELLDEDLLRVTRIGVRRAFSVGEALVERGSDSGGLFVLLSGKVSVDAGGTIQELGPGEFLSEMALLARKEQAGTGPDFFGEHASLDRGHRSANVTPSNPLRRS
jgi:CRP-like cAMP-binding protein